MRTLLTLIGKELLEQLRTKKILIISIMILFSAIASPVIAKLTPELFKSVSMPGLVIKFPAPTYLDALDQFIKNISQLTLLVIIFVVAGAVSDEKNRKTLEILLTKPISRAWFILSKFKAYFISIGLIFAVGALIFYYYTASTFTSFSLTNFAIMAGNVLLYLLMMVSITILASTVLNSSIAAGGVGFVAYILFGVVFGLFDSIKQYSPNMIFSNYKDVVQNGWTNDLFLPLMVILAVIVVSMLLSTLLFQRQEIER